MRRYSHGTGPCTQDWRDTGRLGVPCGSWKFTGDCRSVPPTPKAEKTNSPDVPSSCSQAPGSASQVRSHLSHGLQESVPLQKKAEGQISG